ncbi:hypothetical protein [Filimonas effusa]|uniref:DUF4488 domain-containing protein n=1 Tax=Filimonas effusa TaxID=2508721 RepID=A0A4Q1D958_9BACT|nr:hypothetical protein [Filimonas effusa]RXK85904.1 hypothetical protein ESB13_03585 [Filimonas effusa]
MKQLIIFVLILLHYTAIAQVTPNDNNRVDGKWQLTMIKRTVKEQGTGVLLEEKTITNKDSIAKSPGRPVEVLELHYPAFKLKLVSGSRMIGDFEFRDKYLLLKERSGEFKTGSDNRSRTLFQWLCTPGNNAMELESQLFYKDNYNGRAVVATLTYIYSLQAN